MACMRYCIILLLVLVIAQSVSAAWDNFNGLTRWNVLSSDDESKCGGTVKTKTLNTYIKHIGRVAEISDLGHGQVTASVMGSTFTLPSRIIPDGSGSSKLSGYSFTVSSDCQSFQGIYSWSYKDPYQSCPGTTTIRGTRADATGCPWQGQPQNPAAEKTSLLSEEDKLKAALAKDPKDFWANYDLAEFNKKRGDFKNYFNYLNRATSNEKVFYNTSVALKEEARKRIGLSELPTSDTVPILRSIQDDIGKGGTVHDINFPKPPAPRRDAWKRILWDTWMPDSSKTIRELGSPEVKR